jgi:hypothetical protein
LRRSQQEIAKPDPLDNAMYLDQQGRNIITQTILLPTVRL